MFLGSFSLGKSCAFCTPVFAPCNFKFSASFLLYDMLGLTIIGTSLSKSHTIHVVYIPIVMCVIKLVDWTGT